MLTKIDAKWSQGKYLSFRDEGKVSVGSKTHKFSVSSRQTNVQLGYIKWFNAWRKYCFFTFDAVFDSNCLREIAEYLDQVNQERKEQL